MLVKIRSGGPTETSKDAVDEMLDCHERIRRFTRMATLLPAAAASELVEATQATHRYFSVALPLHSTDEDRSFAPRLIATAPAGDVLAALDEMVAEHVEIEATLAALVPRWAELVADPGRQAALAVELADGAARLAAQFDVHLEKEERVLFPLARRTFTPEMMAGLRAEMRARRQAT